MAWRLANSLVTLRNEVNAIAPNRSKRSDGAIGDAAHRQRASRHNPNSAGVVTALDLTHDLGNGCDIHALADQIRRKPHPNLDYIISNGRIASRSKGWTWRTYTGSNPHRIHAHFAVGIGSDNAPRPPYDDTTPWGISRISPPVIVPDETLTSYTVQRGDTLSGIAAKTGTDWRELARINNLSDPGKLAVGQVLRLRVDGGHQPAARTHTVQRGDTLSEIGKRFGVDWRAIQRLNQITDPNKIRVGQVLRIP